MNRFTGKSLAVGVGALALAVVTLSVASAQVPPPQGQGPRQARIHRGTGGPGHPGGGLGPAGFMLRQLDLTEAQKGQLRAVVDGHKADAQAIATRMREARQGLQAAMEITPVDAAAIRGATAALAAVQADANVHRASMHAEVFSILTDEQKAKATELKAKADARRAAMRDRAKNRVKARGPQPPQPKF